MRSQRFQSESLIHNQEIEIDYPIMNPSVTTLIKVRLLNGQSFNQVLPPDQTSWTIPEEETAMGVAKQYTWLGIKHQSEFVPLTFVRDVFRPFTDTNFFEYLQVGVPTIEMRIDPDTFSTAQVPLPPRRIGTHRPATVLEGDGADGLP